MRFASFKDRCQKLRTKGHALGEISRITKRPKTTVYFHIQNTPISEKLSERIKTIRANSIKGKGPKKGKSLLGYQYKKFNKWTPPLVNLAAHMLFDGSLKRDGVIYYNRSKALINNFKYKMALVYNGKPKIYKNDNGVIRLVYNNVELNDFFKLRSRQLLRSIIKLPADFQREFLRAFFDDEGSVDFRLSHKKRRIKGYQHNISILNLIHKLLKKFEIDSCVDGRFNEILVTKKKNIEQFAKEINFSKGLRVNGKRSNSVWKKNLEKRKILNDLVFSYKLKTPSKSRDGFSCF